MIPERSPDKAPEPPAGGLSTPAPLVSPEQEQVLERLAALIAGSPHNLVARGERADLRRTHIEECVRLRPHLPITPGQEWLDLGTGAGLPGLVLALLTPDAAWTLIDATGKKVRAVKAFAEALGLPNARAVQGRAENLAHQAEFRGRYDGVVSRALAALPVVMELSRGFLAPRGIMAAVKGPGVDGELPAAERARRPLRFGPAHTIPIPDAPRPTVLVTMPALGPPPASFPRRVGVPAAAPLGGDAP